MKRTLLAIVAAFVMITSANAQRLTDIQAEARFITDKMIVELGLSNVQRNSLLNINLNYLDGIRSYRDIDAYTIATSSSNACSTPDSGSASRRPTTSIIPSAGTTTLTYTTYTTSIPSTTIVPTTITRTITASQASRTSTTRSGSTTRNATKRNTSTTRSATRKNTSTTRSATTSTTSQADASLTTTHARPIHGERK